MKTIIASKWRGLVILFILMAATSSITYTVAALGGGGGLTAPGNQSSAAVSAVPGGPGYVTISGIEFKPYNFLSAKFNYLGISIYNTGTASDYFVAVLSIPNGVTINQIVVYYADSDATNDLNVQLIRISLNSNYGDTIATFSSSGSQSGIVSGTTTNIKNSKVDVSNYSYAFQVLLPASANVSLNAIRIDYGYQSTLPAIAK
jgi:hypothetical protein